MPLEIKATIGGRSIKRIVDQALEDVHRTLPKALGAHAVRDIERGSYWPEDTGDSKRSFGYDVAGPTRVDITNSATDSSGGPYPLILERRGHFAEDGLRRSLDKWGNAALDDVAANVQRDLDKERPSTR